MYFLNILVSSFLVGSSFQAVPDSDGWVSVERPALQQDEFAEEEKGVWVVFSKEIEGEKFLVRFPDDPAYRYHPGGYELDAFLGDDHLSLQVEKKPEESLGSLFEQKVQELKDLGEATLIKAKQSADGRRFDLFYKMGEKWVWERIISSSKLQYTFRTESPEMSGEAHRHFISSLDIY